MILLTRCTVKFNKTLHFERCVADSRWNTILNVRAEHKTHTHNAQLYEIQFDKIEKSCTMYSVHRLSLFPRPLLLGAHQSKVLNNQTYFTRIEPLTVLHAVPCTMLKSCIAFSMVCGHLSCFLFILVRHTSSLYTYSSAWWILLSAILLPLRSSLHLIIIIIFFVYVQCVPGWKFFKWNGHFASEPKCTEGKHGILENLQASGEYTFRASIVHLAFYVRKHIVFVCVCEWPFSKQNKYYLEWRKTRSRRQNGVSSLQHRCENNTPANRTNKKNANHHYAYSVCRWSTGSHSIHTSTPDAHWIDLFLFFCSPPFTWILVSMKSHRYIPINRLCERIKQMSIHRWQSGWENQNRIDSVSWIYIFIIFHFAVLQAAAAAAAATVESNWMVNVEFETNPKSRHEFLHS